MSGSVSQCCSFRSRAVYANVIQPLEDLANSVLIALNMATEGQFHSDEWWAHVGVHGYETTLYLTFLSTKRRHRAASIGIVGDLTDTEEFCDSLVEAIPDAIGRSHPMGVEGVDTEFPVGYIKLREEVLG
jgi:hypothetical protein